MTKLIQPVIGAKFTLDWKENDVGDVADDRVRLNAVLTGVSMGTELMWYDASAPALVSGRRSYPYTPGYEFVGTVAVIGSAVAASPDEFPRLAALKEGDRIFALKPHGNMADISESDVWVTIPGNASDEDALGLALTCTCLHAYHRVAPSFGSDSAVIGFGVVGAIMLQVLAASQSGRIVALSRSASKREQARAYGATEVLDTADVTQDRMPAGFTGVDAVFECTGKPQGVALSTKLAANQASIGAVGFYTEPLAIDGEALFAKELTVFGVRASGANGPRTEFVRWPRVENISLARQLLERGDLSVSELLSHRIAPTGLKGAYEMAHEDKEPYGLVAIDWSKA